MDTDWIPWALFLAACLYDWEAEKNRAHQKGLKKMELEHKCKEAKQE